VHEDVFSNRGQSKQEVDYLKTFLRVRGYDMNLVTNGNLALDFHRNEGSKLSFVLV